MKRKTEQTDKGEINWASTHCILQSNDEAHTERWLERECILWFEFLASRERKHTLEHLHHTTFHMSAECRSSDMKPKSSAWQRDLFQNNTSALSDGKGSISPFLSSFISHFLILSQLAFHDTSCNSLCLKLSTSAPFPPHVTFAAFSRSILFTCWDSEPSVYSGVL